MEKEQIGLQRHSLGTGNTGTVVSQIAVYIAVRGHGFSPLKTKRGLLYLKAQSVPRSKHLISVIKTSQLMMYREIIAVCSQIHTKHINTLCGQNVQLYIKIQSVPRSKHTPSLL